VGGLSAWMLSGATPAWSTLTTPTGEGGQGFSAVACPTASVCVTGANRLYDLSVSQATWSDPNVGDGTSAFVGISCSSETTCVASVQLGDGRVATRATTDGGVRWGAVHPIQASDGFPYGLDCVGSSCMADGFDEATNVGWVARSIDSGQRWTIGSEPVFGGEPLLTSLACATALVCTAVYGYGVGTFAHTTNGGKSWSEVTTSAPAASEKFGARIDCMSAHVCLGEIASSFGVERLVSHTGGATWSYGLATKLNLNYDALACVPGGVCELAGAIGATNGAVLLRSTNAGLSWTRVRAPRQPYGASLQSIAVSCWTASRCEIAYDGVSSTRFFVTDDSGSFWTAVPSPIGAVINAVGCSSATCVGLGATGAKPLTAVERSP
jgi:photosystem II stability/assembly factor-like uncharacterized protein